MSDEKPHQAVVVRRMAGHDRNDGITYSSTAYRELPSCRSVQQVHRHNITPMTVHNYSTMNRHANIAW